MREESISDDLDISKFSIPSKEFRTAYHNSGPSRFIGDYSSLNSLPVEVY